jgi:hypothetical protein
VWQCGHFEWWQVDILFFRGWGVEFIKIVLLSGNGSWHAGWHWRWAV